MAKVIVDNDIMREMAHKFIQIGIEEIGPIKFWFTFMYGRSAVNRIMAGLDDDIIGTQEEFEEMFGEIPVKKE